MTCEHECPLCGLPCETLTIQADHLASYHLGGAYTLQAQCWCGQTFDTWAFPQNKTRTAFMDHLAAHGGAAAHYLACHLGLEDP